MSLIDLINNRVEERVGKLPEFFEKGKDIKAGIGFMVYALESIFKSYSLNNTEIENGIVDSSYRDEKYDYGIDSIYITANKECIESVEQLDEFNQDSKFEIHILQFKKGNGIDAGTILKFKDGIEHAFISNELSKEQNEYMFERMNSIRDIRAQIFKRFPPKNITVKVYVAFSGSRQIANQDHYIQEKIEKLKNDLINAGYNNVNFIIVGAQELLDLENGKSEISDIISFKKSFKYMTATSGENKVNGYIAIVNGEEIAKLVEKYQNSLFELNIRDYYTNNTNNEKIVETCSSNEESKYFWSFNNGLTITCKEVEDLPEDKVKVKGLQIVNGCQTSNSLYKAFSNRERFEILSKKENLTKKEKAEMIKIEKERLDPQTSVLVKIIETHNEDLVYKITESTNSQTAITSFSIKANEDIHKNIEKFMKDYGVYYERRVNYYRNKGIATKDIIDIKKMAQVYMSMIKFKPSQAMSSPKKMFIDNYKTIFPNPIEKQNLDYKLYLVPVLIQQSIEQKIKQIQRSKIEKDDINKKILSYGKFHLGCFVLYSLLGKKYDEKGIKNNFEKIKNAITDNNFEVHFNNALKNLRLALEEIGCTTEEEVIKSIKSSDIDEQIKKMIKGEVQVPNRKGKKVLTS
ncbi:TPA: AIPR family protein [Bacillus pseudomycoides]|nr:AIPR family protein [Bacillus pseudomycoides]